MKAILLVAALLVLVMVTPGVAADEGDPVCGSQSPKACVVNLVEAVLGPCHPLYQYVQECNPPDS